MATYQITGPDGQTYEIDAPNEEALNSAVQQMFGGVGEPEAPQGVLGNLQVGLQGVGRGLAEFAGAPVDIVSTIMNAGSGLANMGLDAAGIDLQLGQIESPVGGSEWIREQAGGLSEAFGAPPIEEEALTAGQRLGYNINRFGVQGLAGAGLGSAYAQHRLGQQAAGAAGARTPRLGDAFASAYTGSSPGRVVAADTAAGAGSGIGLTAAQEYFPGSLGAEIVGMLAGGLSGATLSQASRVPGELARYTRDRFTTDPDVPLAPGSLEGTSPRVADLAARTAQESSTDPRQAAQRIAERQMSAEAYTEPMPSSGIASDDTGLIGLELGARQGESRTDPHLRRRFIERDDALRQRAGENIQDLRDPGADLQGGLDYVHDRPKQLGAQRDADALPYLRRAESAGVTVDAQPVADLIDNMLATAKRPAVRGALTEARKMLNKVGSDDLDDTVTGLYETRKAINDIIEGRSDTSTGRFAKSELIEVRNALDDVINNEAPEFGEYLRRYRAGSEPIDLFRKSESVSRLMGEERDLRNVAKRILGGGDFGSDQLMRDINEVVQSSPDAARAWRAAVSDVLAQRVQTTKEGVVSLAALDRTFRQHEKALGEIYSPDDMDTLRRAHDMLRPLQNLAQGVRSGSQTQDNQSLTRLLDAAILAATGNAITTGMIMTRVRRAADLMARNLGLEEKTTSYKVQKLIDRMWFDPDLARHLLERPVEEGTGPLWNGRLQRLLAGTHFARDQVSGEDEPVQLPPITVTPDDDLTDTIMR